MNPGVQNILHCTSASSSPPPSYSALLCNALGRLLYQSFVAATITHYHKLSEKGNKNVFSYSSEMGLWVQVMCQQGSAHSGGSGRESMSLLLPAPSCSRWPLQRLPVGGVLLMLPSLQCSSTASLFHFYGPF